MRRMLDTTCPRCGILSSHEGLPDHVVNDLRDFHVCADGVKWRSGEPVERLVPGPGERESYVLPSLNPRRDDQLFRVKFNGRLTTPTFTSHGAASAYLDMLVKGTRQPEF
jgi:hypothetical protein